MKFILLIITLFCLCSFSLHAQNLYTVKGVARDTSSKVTLSNASISILRAKDSIFRKFTRAANDGSFSISGLPAGKSILLVTYPDYADYVEEFTLDSIHKIHDFGNINMQLESKLLAEVVIQGKVTAIKIKGDTTEYNAAAYVIQPNAKVEDLLKQLPGIQVDNKGNITAQGEHVGKVLVGGEEFFGDDPTLVTKNIRADMVDKVQLYDKKSDQATFTGIDDGRKEKTINIKLKEDKKNGAFGKLDAGAGTNGYGEGQAMYNQFTDKQKFAVYGTIANDGKTGLRLGDNSTYGSASLNYYNDGTISLQGIGGSELDNYDGSYDRKGIPLARSAGAHYDGKWNNDKESINTNYKIGSIEDKGYDNTLTQENLPDGIINSTRNQNYDNYLFRQGLDVTYQAKLDTTADLKLTVDGTSKNIKTQSNDLTVSDRGDNILLNRNSRNQNNNGDQQLFNASALYTKKLKKPGRTLSLLVSETYNQHHAKGYLNSAISYYDSSGALDSMQNINQYSTINTTGSLFSTNLTYSEPLTKTIALLINYGLIVNHNTSDRSSFDQSAPGNYNILIDSLSNSFKFNQSANQAGAFLNYKKGKALLNLGTKAAAINYKEINEYSNSIYKRNFIYWLPQATYKYSFSQQASLSLSYNGNTQAPTIDQLQPVTVNTDPLNVVTGNPNLKPSFANRFNFNYNLYKKLSEQYFSVNGSYSFVTNPIVTNSVTDSAGKTANQFINLSGKKTVDYSLSSSISRTIKPLDLFIALNLRLNGSISYTYINSILNKSDYNTYSGIFSIGKYAQKKYSLNCLLGPTYTIASTSTQAQINANSGGFLVDFDGTIYLPMKFLIESEVSYQYTPKTSAFEQELNRTLIYSTLSRTFLKEDKLKVSLSVNDLLNQNTGFSRNVSGNVITQNNYNTIKRYFMLSINYDFAKFKMVKSH